MDSSYINSGAVVYNLLIADNVAHAIADASKDGMLLVDPQHNIAFVNKTLKEWLLWVGLDTKKWVGTADLHVYNEIKSITRNSHVLELLLMSVSGKRNLISETIDIELSNDIYQYIQLYTSPIYHEVNGYLGRLWIFENKTKERKVDQMKTEFISIASHQLRTPLSAIKGYLSMLISGDVGKLDGDMKEFAESALEGANRLANIVDDLLNVSRLEMGKTEPEKESKDLNKVIENLMDIYQPKIDEKHQHLIKEIDIDDKPFNLDERLLGHVLGNIFDNAIKYTKQEGTITLSVKVIPGAERKVRFEIKDNGVGIPAAQQNRIFEKFFRADNVRNEEFTGTGIGLYYVFKLVNAMRGRIWFDSKENEGTKFYIEIPE